MPKTNLVIGSDKRVAFVGTTGSGKSFLARYLLKPIKRLLVLDPKGTLGSSEWGLTNYSEKAAKALADGESGRLRYPAPISGDWEPVLEWAYECRNICVYIDELYGILAPGGKPPKWLNALYTRGRELGIGVWAATQRPAWVPLVTLSEANWVFMFRLKMPDDRKRMADVGGGPMVEERITDRHGFFVWQDEWDQPLYSSGLVIPKGKEVAKSGSGPR